MTHQTTNPYYCVCVCDNINESRTSIFVTRLYICLRETDPRAAGAGGGGNTENSDPSPAPHFKPSSMYYEA